MNQQRTGYPSIDKPWLKYYSEETISTNPEQCTIYENIYNSNKQYPSDIALMFFGKKVTYKKLFDEINKTAKALVAYGIKAGDNVAICMPAIPETVYAILALNKIGANANMLNPMFTERQLTDRINETDAKLMLVVNELYPKVEKVLPNTKIENIVSCPAVNSLGTIVKKIKKVKNIPNTILWNNFIKRGRGKVINTVAYERNTPAIMVYSSGTTGASKGIQLTNDSINSTINEGVQIGFDWKRGDKWFSQVPIWFSTGVCASTLVPLKYGITIILEPLYDFDIFYKHIIKYKPNFMITACGLLDYLMTKQPKSDAYKEFKFLCAGGEYVTPSAERKYSAWLKNNGNKYGFFKGYGMCECGGTVTATSPKCNAIGSAGIPTPNVVVATFDLKTGEELKYGQRGEIRVLTSGRMLGYYKNPEATARYFHEDKDGRIWACTGDMGYITEDGNLYVDGRISDSYINDNKDVVYLFDIERAVLDIEEVRQCKVVVSEINGMSKHIAHVSLQGDAEVGVVIEKIKDYCTKKLNSSHRLRLVKIYNTSLPVSVSGKLDVEKMKSSIDDILDIT